MSQNSADILAGNMSVRKCRGCGEDREIPRRAHYCSDCNTACINHAVATRGCLACKKVYRDKREDKAKVREQKRRSNKRNLYGITDEELTQLESISECEVCGSGRSLVIDHNHSTGEVRGVLCTNCNVALGNAMDSVSRLLALADYLKEHGSYGA